MKRAYVSQSPTSSYGTGRKLSRSGSGRKYVVPTRVPRGISRYSPGQRTVIPLTANHTFSLTTDFLGAYAFDLNNVFFNGTGTPIGVDGLTEVRNVYDMMRVMKVEITVLPAANVLDYANQTVGTGATNIPYCYTAFDYNDNNTPTIAELMQNPTVRIDSFSKPIRRTLYPRLEGSNGIVDLGQNYKNIFQRSGASSTQAWYGFKIALDMNSVTWNYGLVRVVMKIFYECAQSK